VTIPKNVTSIGYNVFTGCINLASISIAQGNPKYDSRNNCNAIVETTNNTVIIGCKNSTFPSTVKAIGSNAFNGMGLTEVVIPDNIESIASSAFTNDDITTVFIGKGVKAMGNGDNPFKYNENLSNITVASENPYFDSRDNCNAIIETATNTLMVGCQTTVIPNSVTEIDEVAFSGCSNLATLTIPDGVTKIGIRAFRDCSSLQSVDIPDGVTKIQMWAFEGCSGLTDVYCHAANVPSTDSDAFEGVKVADATLHVPAASIDAYKAAEPWSGFGKIVALPSVEPDAIQGVTSADASDNVWYTLDGMKLQGEPTVPGVYVKDGKKVVVK
jgi:hypothetical protein